MCGLIAWIGEVPKDIDELCKLTGGRGPHQHGWAIIDDFVTIKRDSGPIRPIRYGSFVIGHSRLATSGSRSGTLPPLEEAQPYSRDNYVIAHNGILFTEESKNYSQEVDTLMLFDTDEPHNLLQYHHDTEGVNHALITATKHYMAIGSYGHPLFIREENSGLTVTSVPNDEGDWERVIGQIVFSGFSS